MESAEIIRSTTALSGVKPANQARSRELQANFARAGREMLKTTRLADIRIPDLSEAAGSSIGGFYSRFENRDVFFQFMQASMLEEHGRIIDQALDADALSGLSDVEVIERIVAGMMEVFSEPWRGVLRESYSGIAEGRDVWAPMRDRGRQTAEAAADHFAGRFAGRSGGPSRDNVIFAMQMLFSALNNDLMNPNLPYAIGEKAFEQKLVEMLCRFLQLRSRGRPRNSK